MRHGFIKVAACTPKIRVADPVYNSERIIEALREAEALHAQIIVFPELCVTGYTCGDLFLQDTLLSEAREALFRIAEETDGLDALVFVGLPLCKDGKLYSVAAALHDGVILGFVPKRNIPNYGEFYEGRHFTAGRAGIETCEELYEDEEIPFGGNLLFVCDEVKELVVGCELCEDLWVTAPPSEALTQAGATLIVNLSASDETVSKEAYRRLLLEATSARELCGYVYASAGEGESTQDMVFSGHNLIAENGTILAESALFTTGLTTAEIDVQRLLSERRRRNTFGVSADESNLLLHFHLVVRETELQRSFPARPFVPESEAERDRRCETILSLQALGLKRRMEHIGGKKAVLGISGGLDSTLALLVTAKAFDMLGLSRENILAVTMPCFGTTDRTYENACTLTARLHATLREVDIKEAVRQHFRDIGQSEDTHDVTYENSQARERTQVLMDIANKENALVVGTGDLSELALGWATYNGDHMSMYGVNGGVPKTLVRHLVRFYADGCGDEALQRALYDVLDTPVSPELLPPVDGVIAQKTEELVGPYELHDFFLYYMLRFGFAPDKIYRMACGAFSGENPKSETDVIFDKATILRWLKVFYRRFFSQQFKRSCLPDGPKVGSVSVSPRGDLRMPSDASARIWLETLKALGEEQVQGQGG